MIRNATNTLHALFSNSENTNDESEQIVRKTIVEHFNINLLPDTLFNLIGSKLSLHDLFSIKVICNNLNRALKNQCLFRLKKQYNAVISHFPSHVIGSIPLSVWLDLEWVEFQP